jgi:hypothetical protein
LTFKFLTLEYRGLKRLAFSIVNAGFFFAQNPHAPGGEAATNYLRHLSNAEAAFNFLAFFSFKYQNRKTGCEILSTKNYDLKAIPSLGGGSA